MNTKKHELFRKNIKVWHEGAALIRTVYSKDYPLGKTVLFEEWQCPKCEKKYKLWANLLAPRQPWQTGEPGEDLVRRVFVSRPLSSKAMDHRGHSACTPEHNQRIRELRLCQTP